MIGKFQAQAYPNSTTLATELEIAQGDSADATDGWLKRKFGVVKKPRAE